MVIGRFLLFVPLLIRGDWKPVNLSLPVFSINDDGVMLMKAGVADVSCSLTCDDDVYRCSDFKVKNVKSVDLKHAKKFWSVSKKGFQFRVRFVNESFLHASWSFEGNHVINQAFERYYPTIDQ